MENCEIDNIELVNNELEDWKDYLTWQNNVQRLTQVKVNYIFSKEEDNNVYFIVVIPIKEQGKYLEIFNEEKIIVNPGCNYFSKRSIILDKPIKVENITLEEVFSIEEIEKSAQYDELDSNKNIFKKIYFSSLNNNKDCLNINGYFTKSLFGTETVTKRQKDAIDDLKLGNSINESISKWIANSSNADSELNISNEEINYLTKNKLNKEQIIAINGIVNSKELFLIQGPPGTGKTTVISEGVYQLCKKGKRVLIASQTNLAVDNVLEKLEVDSSIRSIRFGNITKVSEGAMKFTKEYILKEYYESIISNVKSFIKNSNKNYLEKIKLLSNISELAGMIIDIDKERNYINIDNQLLDLKHNIETCEKEACFIKEIEPILSEWVNRLTNKELIENDEIKFIEKYLESCNVVAISCTAKQAELLQYNISDFDVVIIDEVSKAILPELLISMISAKRVVLVGDQNQLRPIFNINRNDYYELCESIEHQGKFEKELYDKYHKMVVSSLFERYFNAASENNKIMLNQQYRMHKDIRETINIFYDNKLVDGKKQADEKVYIDKFSNKNRVVWIDSSRDFRGVDRFAEFNGTSILNKYETELIIDRLKKLNRVCINCKNVEVAIISFYSAQVEYLRKLVYRENLANLNIEINTVDSFQGKEKEIVFVSMVAHKPAGEVSNHMKDFRRINVAFSRAKELLVIFGACNYLSTTQVQFNNKKVKVYSNIIKLLENKNAVIRGN